MILSPDSLTPELIREISFRSRCLPMPVAQTSRLLLRELSENDLSGLLQLQQENKKNPGGCFFPKNCTAPDDFLKDYIKHQYYCYGYGIFGIFSKANDAFMGIAGFSTTDLSCADAEISYALLKRYQRHGYAREALKSLLAQAGQKWQIHRLTARIAPGNLPSVRLAKDLSIPFTIQSESS